MMSNYITIPTNYQILEQRKLSDVTMAMVDDPNYESHVPEKPRRKKKHFKLVNMMWVVFSLRF